MELTEIAQSLKADLQRQADQEHLTLEQVLLRFINRIQRAKEPLRLEDIPVSHLVWNKGQHFSSKESLITLVKKIHPDVVDFT